MKNKQKVLIVILIALVLSSALLLYRGFSSQPLSIVSQKVSSQDVIIKTQVDEVKAKIVKAITKIDTGGILDQLIQNPQFQELSAESIKVYTPGLYGRGNPFVPPQIAR